MNNLKKILTLSLIFGLIASVAMAQEPAAKKKKRLKIEFDNELVNGANPNPEIEFLFQRKSFNYNKMLKFRKNFIHEAERSREFVNGSP